MTLDQLIEGASARNSIRREDIATYHEKSGLKIDDALDAIARGVARRYADGALGFTTADFIMNCVFAYGASKGLMPPFMFSVFQAFDAGEFYPDAIRDPSPEERFTRPQIALILANDDRRDSNE